MVTYLHDFVEARRRVRELVPQLVAALIPTLDRLGLFESCRPVFEGRPVATMDEVVHGDAKCDALVIDGVPGLPVGYALRIDFYPVKLSSVPDAVGGELAG